MEPSASDPMQHVLQTQQNILQDIRDLRDSQKEDVRYLTEQFTAAVETIKGHIDEQIVGVKAQANSQDERIDSLEHWRTGIFGAFVVFGIFLIMTHPQLEPVFKFLQHLL